MGILIFISNNEALKTLREAEKRTEEKQSPKSSNKQDYTNQKRIKGLHNKLSNIEAKIAALEKEIKEDDVHLETDYDKTVSDVRFFDKYQANKRRLEDMMIEWEQVQEEIETLVS